jgi:hypothetical protein
MDFMVAEVLAILPMYVLLGMPIQDVPPPATIVGPTQDAGSEMSVKDAAKQKAKLKVDGLGGNTDGLIGQSGNGERLFGAWARGLNVSGGWNLVARANNVDGSQQARDWFNFQNNNQFLINLIV